MSFNSLQDKYIFNLAIAVLLFFLYSSHNFITDARTSKKSALKATVIFLLVFTMLDLFSLTHPNPVTTGINSMVAPITQPFTGLNL